jgi:hypothetical protein
MKNRRVLSNYNDLPDDVCVSDLRVLEVIPCTGSRRVEVTSTGSRHLIKKGYWEILNIYNK